MRIRRSRRRRSRSWRSNILIFYTTGTLVVILKLHYNNANVKAKLLFPILHFKLQVLWT